MQSAVVDVQRGCTMRCTMLESTKLSEMLMFVAKSPQIPSTLAGKVEII